MSNPIHNHDGIALNLKLARIERAVAYGLRLGLHVNAGHGLDYHNVKAVAAIAGVEELNIGHAIVARAVFTGLSEAVREMKRIISDPALRLFRGSEE